MEGFQFIDIILLAMVAGFLILRLRSTLGRRTGNEQRPDQFSTNDNILDLPNRKKSDSDLHEAQEIDPAYLGTPFEEGLKQIILSDTSFTVASFLDGAGKAFETIVLAYAQHDTDTLKPLLADDVYSNFASAIQEREDRREQMETVLVVIKPAELEEVTVKSGIAAIAVKFESEQINVIKDPDGVIIDGDPDAAESVTDVWTFERALATGNPNWRLIATRSVD